MLPAARVGERILLTLWVGALWSIGFLAAPILFATLEDRALAGTLAGEMFRAVAYLGLVCGGFLLLANWLQCRGRWFNGRALILLAMLALVIAGQFIVSPLIGELREAGRSATAEFARLHGLASVLYGLTSLLGLALVMLEPGGDSHRGRSAG